MLKEKYYGEYLPDGWYFDGTYYLDCNGDKQKEHPGLEAIVAFYIEEQNGQIGTYNREVQKLVKTDQLKYESWFLLSYFFD